MLVVMEKKEAPPQPPNPAMPYREDCWSEGATSTLIDTWGDRFLELNRGNLRQQDWKVVADAVNSRRTVVRRPPRTDVQCKNRVDTLKKKYKAEKARVVNSGGTLRTRWSFYERLDALIGPPVSSSKKPSAQPPLALPLPPRKGSPLLPAAAAARPSSAAGEKRRLPAPQAADSPIFLQSKAAAAAAAARKDEEPADSGGSSRSGIDRFVRGEKTRGENLAAGGGGGGSSADDTEAVRELAQAILQFGEVYERVETEKQRRMVELERQRMEFGKGLEFQRIQMFVDSMLQLEKIKRTKRDISGWFHS